MSLVIPIFQLGHFVIIAVKRITAPSHIINMSMAHQIRVDQSAVSERTCVHSHPGHIIVLRRSAAYNGNPASKVALS
jgi:hypothetical protein